MTILSLWQPILATTAVVFIAGAVIWMVMPWHKKDWQQTVNEEAVREALRSTPPGMYTVPNIADQAQFKDPAVRQKLIDGPQAYITVVPSGIPQMGGKLLLMLAYNLLVAIICAYVLSRSAASASDYLSVFRISGTAAFLAYGVAYIQDSIWFGRSWGLTARSLLDALIYALLTGGIFGWLSV